MNAGLKKQPIDGTTDGLMTLDAAAEMLSCTPAALRKWLGQGRLERVKVGTLTRVRRADVHDIVKNGLPPRRTTGTPR